MAKEVKEEKKKLQKSGERTILIVVALIVVLIALFLQPNGTGSEFKKGSIKLNNVTCDTNTVPTEEAGSLINKISCSEYNDIINDNSKESIVLIARPSCGYCTKFIPVLEEILKENNKLVINYFDVDNLSETENKSFYSSSEFYTKEEYGFGTPTIIITKDSEIIKYNIGYLDKKVISGMLKNAGFIK